MYNHHRGSSSISLALVAMMVLVNGRFCHHCIMYTNISVKGGVLLLSCQIWAQGQLAFILRQYCMALRSCTWYVGVWSGEEKLGFWCIQFHHNILYCVISHFYVTRNILVTAVKLEANDELKTVSNVMYMYMSKPSDKNYLSYPRPSDNYSSYHIST